MYLGRAKLGFSILEAIFAIAFLIIVGVGMQLLSNASLRLTDATEIKTTVNAANGEYLSFIAGKVKLAKTAGLREALRAEIKAASETAEYEPNNAIGEAACDTPASVATKCDYHTYLDCPTTVLDAVCGFSKEPKPIQIGNKLSVVRLADISWPKPLLPDGTPDTLTVTVSVTGRWGGGPTKKESVSQRFVFDK